VTGRLVPEPRAEVVELLAEVLLTRHDDAEAAALHEARRAWTTGAERRLAYALAIGELEEVQAIVSQTRDIVANSLDVLSVSAPTVVIPDGYDDQ
jgi:hypothetical protein